jgi:ATP-dependent helicase/nuclease subunit A
MKDEEVINKLAGIDIAPTHVRLGARRYIDWILPVVNEKAPNPWQWSMITEINRGMNFTEMTSVERLTPPEIDFDEVFARTYPFEELTMITAKQSITQRKIEETVPLFKGIPEQVETVVYDQPSFIQTETSATEIGTAFHQFMQHLPVQVGHTLESLRNLKDALVARNIIKSQLADKINLENILNFTKSTIYGELLMAETVQKELPFTMLFNAGTAREAKALLQGVIDLLAEFEDEVWIVDYKTDKVGHFALDEPMLRRRYDIQMKYYLQAMRDIYPDKTVIAQVYFMRARRSISYK